MLKLNKKKKKILLPSWHVKRLQIFLTGRDVHIQNGRATTASGEGMRLEFVVALKTIQGNFSTDGSVSAERLIRSVVK